MPDSADQRSGKGNSPIIVAIGASAGGVQALQTLFDALPDGTGASFVVIVHLDPQAHSDLASILASRTRMPVVQVQTREDLRPYYSRSCRQVIPDNRALSLSEPEAEHPS
jgi:two-component system CheB/CheR fusion protein